MKTQPTPMERRGGFSVIELTMALSVMTVVGAAVVGDVVGSQARLDLEHARAQLLGDLRAARMVAVTRNLDVQVLFDDSRNQYTIWADANEDGTMDTGEYETTLLDADHRVSLWSYPNQGTFHPTGTFSSSANFGYLALSGANGYHALHVTPLGHVGEITQSAQPYHQSNTEHSDQGTL